MRALAAVVLALALPAQAQEADEANEAAVSDDDDTTPEAEAPKPVVPTKPGDKLVQLVADATGIWKCTLHVTQPDSDAVDVPATVKIEAVVEGYAYAIEHATQPKTGAVQKMMTVWSQDPMTGKLTEAAWDNKGGSWKGTSPGPRQEKTIWAQDGTSGGEALKMRTTWVRAGPKELHRTTEIKFVGKGWNVVYDETCKK